MLSTDSFKINGDTLFYVVKQKPPKSWITAVNRPCATCTNRFPKHQCGDCDGTGRHTFDIKVDIGSVPEIRIPPVVDTLRVHVSNVLSVVDGLGTLNDPLPRIAITEERGPLLMKPFVYPSTPITLPANTTAGMWVVRFKIHNYDFH